MRPPSLKAMWPFFLHIQNYYDLHAHNALNIGATAQTWTLASLAQFYVVIPFVLLGLWRLGGAVSNGKIAALPWITALAFIACFAMRWYGAPADNNAYVASKHYFPTHLRLDELLAGVLAAHWVLHSPRRLARAMRFWPVILIASLAAFLPVGLRKEESPPFLFIWGYTLAGIGSVGLILIAWWFGEGRYRGDTTRGIKPASLPVRWFAQIGVWSYSIYLWHQPTGQILALKLRNGLFNRMVRMHMDPWHWRLQYFIAAAIYFPIAIGLGVAMYYLVEKPSLKLRERLVPRHALRSGRTEGPPVQAE